MEIKCHQVKGTEAPTENLKEEMELHPLQLLFIGAMSGPKKTCAIDFEAEVVDSNLGFDPFSVNQPVHWELQGQTLTLRDPVSTEEDFYSFVREMPEEVRGSIESLNLEVSNLSGGPLLSLFPNLKRLEMDGILFKGFEEGSRALEDLFIKSAGSLESVEFLKDSKGLKRLALEDAVNLFTLRGIETCAALQTVQIPNAGVQSLQELESKPIEAFDLRGVKPDVVLEFTTLFPEAKELPL